MEASDTSSALLSNIVMLSAFFASLRMTEQSSASISCREIQHSKHNRIPRRNAGLAQAFHALEEFFLSIGQDVARPEHEIHFPHQRGRFFDGKPVAGMGAVVDNFLQQDRELRSGISLKPAQKLPHILRSSNVAQALGNQIALVLTRLLDPAVVRFPLFFGGIPRQRRRARLVPHEPSRERMRLGLAIPDAGATYECVETHSSLSSAILVLRLHLGCHSRGRGRPLHTITARRWGIPESCSLLPS